MCVDRGKHIKSALIVKGEKNMEDSKISVLIADDNQEFAHTLSNYINEVIW